MGVITNIWVAPATPEGDADDADDAFDALAALLSAGYLAGPATVGPAFEPDGAAVEPQAAAEGWGRPAFAAAAKRFDDHAAAVAAFRGATAPALIAFAGLNAAHPDIRADFDHYEGYECAVGVYRAPEGYRLVLREEPSPEAFEAADGPLDGPVLHDLRLTRWIHLQGKVAPWRDAVLASRFAAALRGAWPELQVVEYAYL